MKSMLIAAIIAAIITGSTSAVLADECHDRFSELLVNGSAQEGPLRLYITQEIVGGKTSLNYHHSDGNNNGMTEMIDPEGDPWSLFIGDNMYSSTDKGQSWKLINTWDAEKSRNDMKAALTKDSADAKDISCGQDEIDGKQHDVIKGTYTSSMTGGATIAQTYWVDPSTGWLAKSYSHYQSEHFESKTTQVVQPATLMELPSPE